jgi:hypothetical protein
MIKATLRAILVVLFSGALAHAECPVEFEICGYPDVASANAQLQELSNWSILHPHGIKLQRQGATPAGDLYMLEFTVNAQKQWRSGDIQFCLAYYGWDSPAQAYRCDVDTSNSSSQLQIDPATGELRATKLWQKKLK